MEQFYEMTFPPDREKITAFWYDMKRWDINCPVNPQHKRQGLRIGDLKVTLPEKINDIIWTDHADILIQDHVLEVFQQANLTGYEVRPVKIINNTAGLKLWELVITGWGGVTQDTSIKVNPEKSCPDCGILTYTKKKGIYLSAVFTLGNWDGQDFFIVWPFPKYKLIDDKVCQVMNENNISGANLIPIEKVQTSAFTASVSPGRLHYYMPDARAHELGDKLGIY